MTQYLRIGLIARPHGVKGAIKLMPTTDDVSRFKGLKEGFVEHRGQYLPVKLKVLSVADNGVIIQLEGVNTPEEAVVYKEGYLCVDRQHAVKLPEYSYFVSDLIGLQVTDTEGKQYGRLTEVYETGANDVYEIERGKLMVPALKRVIERVDVEQGLMTLKAEVLREVGLFAD